MTRIQNRAELVAGAARTADRSRRALALDLFDAALTAVDPVICTRKALRDLREQGELSRPVTLFAFGKAARGMAEAALSEVAVARGIVIGFEAGMLGPLTLFRGDHPIPSDDAPTHGEAMLALAEQLGAEHTALVLVSGGGSALLEVPRPGLTMSDLQATTRALLASGASIQEVNVVRCALSAVKGGKLARAMAPAHVINIVLSDVIGSPLPSIASGPTVAPLARDLIAEIVDRYDLKSQLGQAVIDALAQHVPVRDSELGSITSVIAADNLTAQQAMVDEARRRGHTVMRREAYVEGEAKTLGPALLREARAHHAIWIAGGETTVTLGANAGRGGRNQELVLSAGPALNDELIASLGTDGIDGASDAAGGLLDRPLLTHAAELSLDLEAAVTRHDAGSLLARAGGAILTGKTGTNVADVCLVVP